MKLTAIVSLVREQHAVSKAGTPVIYRDVHLVDAGNDPLTRFNGEVVYRPSDAEYLQQPVKRGEKFVVSVLQILEIRNGNPVCRVDLQPSK